MRRSPGRWWLLLLFAATLLSAAPYRWSASISQPSAYVHEAVELQYTCRFDGTGALYIIDFDPPRDTEAYRMKLLHESERIEGGRRINEYRFLLFPKQEGPLELEFPLLMRKTTQDSIENTVIGRDNVEELDFTDTAMKTPPLHLEVKGHGLRLVGSYAMTVEASADEVRAYEPLHVTVTVTGEGNMDRLEPFVLEIPGAEVFSEAPEQQFERSEEGLKGSWVQRFAVVAPQDFTLPPLTLEYFDTQRRAPAKIVSESRQIRVSGAYRPEELLDAPEEESRLSWRPEYLYYLLTFLAGLLAGRWGRLPSGVRKPEEKGFAARVRAAGSRRELAVLLALRRDARFEALIEALESERISLAEGKRRAQETH